MRFPVVRTRWITGGFAHHVCGVSVGGLWVRWRQDHPGLLDKNRYQTVRRPERGCRLACVIPDQIIPPVMPLADIRVPAALFQDPFSIVEQRPVQSIATHRFAGRYRNAAATTASGDMRVMHRKSVSHTGFWQGPQSTSTRNTSPTS